MITSTPLFIILVASLLSSFVFSRFHLPWVAALIFAGLIIGPYGLGVVELDHTLQFFGELGLVFLMFMAGLQIQFSSFKLYKRMIATMSLFTAGIPMLLGIGVGMIFGYDWLASVLIGIIFVGSSVAVVIPSLEQTGLITTKLGKVIVASVMVNDITALVILSIILQLSNPITHLPLPIFYAALLLVLVGLRWGVPKLHELRKQIKGQEATFEREIRVVFAMLLGIVILFEVLGLHAITAGFFAGLIMSDAITTQELREKLHALAYGIFIPLFFVIVGIRTDVGYILSAEMSAWWLMFWLLTLSMAGKLVSGWFAAQVLGFPKLERSYISFAMVPQLSTTLAAAFVGLQFGIVDAPVITAMILLGIISTLVSSLGLQRYGEKLKLQKA